jgi:hypothetical protein
MKERDATREKREEVSGREVETVDGRDIDPRMGTLAGEASHMEVRTPAEANPLHGASPHTVGAVGAAGHEASYYGLPALKPPVWKGYIPAYFFLGGAAGAAAAVGAAAQLAGGPSMRGLVMKARLVAAFGTAAGAVLLVLDLGRPARFLNMMRVFRPTSPMNLGTWVLSAAGAGSAGALVLGRSKVGDAAGILAGAAGLPLATYTAVLIANTAVPVWQGASASLPVLFGASASTSAASILELMPLRPAEARAVRVLGVAAKIADLAAARSMERELGPARARPLREGPSSMLWRAASAMTAASLVLSLLPLRSRGARTLTGLLGAAGSLTLRFAVASAGKASAADPRATFEPQRAARDARRQATTRA